MVTALSGKYSLSFDERFHFPHGNQRSDNFGVLYVWKENGVVTLRHALFQCDAGDTCQVRMSVG